MNAIPLSYANFLILWVLQTPSHGYEIMKNIANKTNNIVTIGPATMYRSLSYYLKNGYIELISEIDNKKKYQLTSSGKELLNEQIDFLALLYDMTNQGRV
ncbi:PadR family transcriptional regulator [Paraliobacillus sp. JSM ZJ581]|uniref:PadR family transcriptional regulator n=1 Tax=Paraliobacillus sp. JSM ZJ581 TaxID=3342118 RepID=UPI0035A8BBA5